MSRIGGRPSGPFGCAYLDASPAGSIVAMAHRGGAEHPANRGRENTLWAFRHAAGLGYTYLETDVHATKDGVLLAFHDEILDRVTDQSGAIAELTYAQVVGARIAGQHHLPTMAELLEALPEALFNIDLKSDAAVVPLVHLLDETQAWDRVLVGGFSWSRIRRFRRLTKGRVATSAAPMEVALVRLLPSAHLTRLLLGGKLQAVQIPVKQGHLTVLTRGLLRRAHAANLQVHVWTIDDADEMLRLLDLGVDGLISDRTDTLKTVLTERNLWRQS
jgi:glycerophosphoryl diester phosphodiesterase